MAQRNLVRTQGSLNLNGFSQKQVQQLGKGLNYREIALRLSGAFTIAGANNLTTTLGRGDEWSFIDRVDLVRNGGDVVRSFSGFELRELNARVLGANPRLSSTLGDGATANPTFDSTLVLPLWQPLAVKPMDTALPTGNLGTLELQVTTNAAAQVFSTNSPSAVAATLQIMSMESFGAVGDFADCLIRPIRTVVSSSSTAFEIPIPQTGIYRGFLINVATDATAQGTDRPSDLNNIKIVSGGTTFFDLPAAAARDWYRQRLARDRALVQTVAATAPVNGLNLNQAKSMRSDADAWYWIDICPDGYLGESINADGLSDLKFQLDITAAASRTVTIYPFQIFPAKKNKAA